MGITRVRNDGVAASSDAIGGGARVEQQQEKKASFERRKHETRFRGSAFLDDVGENKRKLETANGEKSDDKVDEAWNANQLLVDLDSDQRFSHSTSRIAALNRELKALEVRYFRTRMKLEKSMEKNDHLRQDMTKLRGHATKLERETCKLRSLIDRIQGEKKQLELQAINNRDYAKKIEQRFFMGTKGQSIIQCNVDLGKRVKELERSAGEKDAAFESQRRELQDAQEKFNILKRALETRFEELQLNGSLHTGILFELTRLQDQSTSLALQLSDERKANKALEAKFLNLQAKETDLEETLVVREVMIGNQERERAALEEKLAQLWNEKQTFAFEKSTLLKFIQEQAEVKFQLDAQIKQIQDSKMAELAALRQKLELSVEDKQKLHDSLRETSFRCENLQHECQTLRNALQDEQQTKIELEAREQELQLRIQRLNDDLSKKEDDFAAARDVCRELQTTLEGVEQDSANLRAQIEELEAVEVDLRQQLAQKLAEELALRAAMENSLHDLETLSRQRNEVAKAMNEAVTISASSLDEQQALESKLETQRKQLEQLKNSKNLLQNAMLEQLSALRKQLQLERIQRIDAEAKLKQLLANGFGSTSQRSNALKQQKHRNSPHENSVPPSRRPEATDKVHETMDPDEPQPLPPPMMAATPSPLPPYLSHLSSFGGSQSDSSSSDDDDDDEEDYNRNEIMLPSHLQVELDRDETGGALAHTAISHPLSPCSPPPLSASPEHKAGHVSTLPQEQISLLELAGDL